MWSRRFTDFARSCCVLAGLALAGCAGIPGTGAPVPGATADGPVIPANALTLYEQAAAAMAAGDDIDAALRFQEFILRYPDYPGAHVNLAILNARAGDEAAAEASINAALAIDPAHAPALNQLGMWHRRAGRFEEAEDAYLQALGSDPDYALAHYNLGVLNELYFRRLEAALEHFQRYQALSGEDEQVGRWIADLERRITANQRTANVTE